MMNSPVRRAWALTVMWMGVIVLESSIGSLANTGHILGPLLHYLFPRMTAGQFEFVHAAIRKSGHFFGYGMLSFLFYRAWWTTLRARSHGAVLSWREMFRGWMWRAAVLALLATVAVAAADEFHQSFEPGRTASTRDVALDEFGGYLAQSILVIASTVSAGNRVRRREQRPQPITSS